MPQLDLAWFVYSFFMAWFVLGFFTVRCFIKAKTEVYSGSGLDFSSSLSKKSWESSPWESYI